MEITPVQISWCFICKLWMREKENATEQSQEIVYFYLLVFGLASLVYWKFAIKPWEI